MSIARLASLAVLAAAVPLPALTQDAPPPREQPAADRAQPADKAPPSEIMPTVLVTEKARRNRLISKPAILRYAGSSDLVAKLVAEGRGQDPDRIRQTGSESQ